jgi:ketosteroid isomerase-like protein
MSEENVEVVKRVYASQAANKEALDKGDDIMSLPSWELWHPDAVLEELSEVPDASIYRGQAEIAKYLLNILELWKEARWEGQEFIDLGDDVVVRAEVVGESKQGVPASMEVVQVWTVRDGRVARVRAFSDMKKALEAAGLRE